MTLPTKNPKSKAFQFLKNRNWKTSRIFKGFEDLAQSAGELWW